MQFGLRGTLLFSSALAGLAALGIIKPQQPAVAAPNGTVTLNLNGTITTYTAAGTSTGIISAATDFLTNNWNGPGQPNATITVFPGPTVACVGTVPAGANSCVLGTNPFNVGDAVVFGTFDTNGLWQNGLTPSVPLRSVITAISGSTITWGQTAWQTSVNPRVTYDYDDKGITTDFDVTFQCATIATPPVCHIIPTTPVGNGSGIFKIGGVGIGPSVLVNGFDLEGGGGTPKASITTCTYVGPGGAFQPNAGVTMTGFTVCPGMIIPATNEYNIFPIGFKTVSITNTYAEWAYDAYLTGETPGTVVVRNSSFRYNGANDGQSHNMYNGRTDDFDIENSTVCHSWNGNDVKTRALRSTIVNNVLGCPSVLFPNGQLVADYSGNAAQTPDPGNETITGNTFYIGPARTNPNPVSWAGSPQPWAGAKMLFTNNAMTIDTGSGATVSSVLWNNTQKGTGILAGGTCEAEVSNNTIVVLSGPAFTQADMIGGLGCQRGNTVNGTLIATSTSTTPWFIDSGAPPAIVCDFRATATPGGACLPFVTGPYTVSGAIPTGVEIIGDSHFLTVNNTGTVGNVYSGVGFGCGGGTYTGINLMVTDFCDGSATAPAHSNFTGANLAGSSFLNNNGDSVQNGSISTAGGGGSGWYQIGAQNTTIQPCDYTNTTLATNQRNCGTIYEAKSPFPNVYPSVLIIGRGSGTSNGIVGYGGIITVQGTLTNNIWGLHCSSDSLACPSTPYSVLRLLPGFTQLGTAYSGAVVGQDVTMSPSGISSGARPGMNNYWYIGSPSWPSFGATNNDTFWFGAAAGYIVTPNIRNGAIFNWAGYIPGSGSAKVNTQPAQPNALVEAVAGYGGGTLTISGYSSATRTYYLSAVGYAPGAVFNIPAAGTYTTPDNTTIALPAFGGTLSTTPPVANTVSITAPPSQTLTAGVVTQVTGVSFADPASDTGCGGYVCPGMGLMTQSLNGGSFSVNGMFTSFVTISPDGHTLQALGPRKMLNAIVAAESISAQANDVLTISFQNQWGYRPTPSTKTVALSVSGAASNDLVLTGPGTITIVPTQGGVSVPIGLTDQWASTQPGTLVANISDFSGSPLVFNGSTYASGTLNVGLSYTAMVSALSGLLYFNNQISSVNDSITASVTNQGLYAQTNTVFIRADPSYDMSFNLPSNDTATALVPYVMSGTAAPSVSDGWAGQTGAGVTVTEVTNYGSLIVSGATYQAGQTVTLNGQLAPVNAILASQTFGAPVSGTAVVQMTGDNDGVGTTTGSYGIAVVAQGVSTDLAVTVPPTLSMFASGTQVVQGVSISGPWSKTTAGAVTLKLHGTASGILFNGVSIARGSTGTFQNSVDNLNTIFANGGFSLIGPGTAGCDYVVVDVINQGAVEKAATITVTDSVLSFAATGPTSGVATTGSTLALVGYALIESIPSPTVTANVVAGLGTLLIGGQAYPPGASGARASFSGPIGAVNSIIGTIRYVPNGVPGADSIIVTAVDAGNNTATPATTNITIVAGTATGCPLP